MVLADGTVVHANPQQNSDLFWALKGGGPNFGNYFKLHEPSVFAHILCTGIVTKFELRTIPVKNIWYELNAYNVNQASEIFDAFEAYQKQPDTKGTLALIVSLTSITVGFIYSQPVERPKAFAAFYDITPVATLVPSTMGTVQILNMLSGGITNSSSPRYAPRPPSLVLTDNIKA